MKKVLVLLAKGFEEIEAVTIIDILRRAQVLVHVCSISGKDDVEGSHGITLKSDMRLDYLDTKTDKYDLIFIPGGMPGAANLRDDPRVIELLKEFNDNKLLISAICAGPIVLDEAGLLKGRIGTSFPTFRDQLKYEEYKEETTVVSSNIITSRGPGTAMDLGFTILEQLGLESDAQRLREDMMYNFMVEEKIKKDRAEIM